MILFILIFFLDMEHIDIFTGDIIQPNDLIELKYNSSSIYFSCYYLKIWILKEGFRNPITNEKFNKKQIKLIINQFIENNMIDDFLCENEGSFSKYFGLKLSNKIKKIFLDIFLGREFSFKDFDKNILQKEFNIVEFGIKYNNLLVQKGTIQEFVLLANRFDIAVSINFFKIKKKYKDMKIIKILLDANLITVHFI